METQTALAKVTRLLSKAKAYVAALTVAVPGLTSFVVNWVESGKWDANEWRILLATAIGTLLTGGATYATPPGKAEVEIIPGSLEEPGVNDDDIGALDEDAPRSNLIDVSPEAPVELRPEGAIAGKPVAGRPREI